MYLQQIHNLHDLVNKCNGKNNLYNRNRLVIIVAVMFLFC